MESRPSEPQLQPSHLNLAVAESIYDIEACTNRLVEVYLSVHQLQDLSTKSSCLARLLSALKVVDSSGEIERKEDLGALSTEELQAAISDLLGDTAEQVDVTRRIIGAPAALDSGRAFAVAENLNTAARREEALLLAIDGALENDSDGIDLLELIRAAFDTLIFVWAISISAIDPCPSRRLAYPASWCLAARPFLRVERGISGPPSSGVVLLYGLLLR